jgi:hypothetical protein
LYDCDVVHELPFANRTVQELTQGSRLGFARGWAPQKMQAGGRSAATPQYLGLAAMVLPRSTVKNLKISNIIMEINELGIP